jgi:O-antigen ligase
MFIHRPVRGVGLNRFAENYVTYSIDPVIWGELDTHNTYIKIAAETGIIGIVSFLILIWLSFRNAFRLYRLLPNVGNASQRAFIKGLFPGLTAVFTAAFFLSQSWLWFVHIMIAMAAVAPYALRSFSEPADGEGVLHAAQSS